MSSPPTAELDRVTEVLQRAASDSGRTLDPAIWRRAVKDLPGPPYRKWQWATAAMTVLLARRLCLQPGDKPGVPEIPDPTIHLGDQANAVLKAYTDHGLEALHALTGELDTYQGEAITTALLVTLVGTRHHADEAARDAWAAAVLAHVRPVPPVWLDLLGRALVGAAMYWPLLVLLGAGLLALRVWG